MSAKEAAKEALERIMESLSSGEVVRSDLEPNISTLIELIEQSNMEKKMDCAIACNGVCRSCRKPVVWAVMVPSMKPTPINPVLEEGGNVELRRNKIGKLYAKVTGPNPEQKKFTSHFATCPQAKDWKTRMVEDTIEKLS